MSMLRYREEAVGVSFSKTGQNVTSERTAEM